MNNEKLLVIIGIIASVVSLLVCVTLIIIFGM